MEPTINNTEYLAVMTGEGFSRGDLKYRHLQTSNRYRIRFAFPPPPGAQYMEAINLKIKVDDYEWNVHGQFIASMSAELRAGISADSKDNTIDLTGEKPELIVRMIMFCYYERYPVSPDFEVVPGSKTVSEVMCENRVSATSSSDVLGEPKFDAVLHLQMFDLAKKLEMNALAIYANKRCKKILANETEGFWGCIEYLNTSMKGGVAEKVERKLIRLVEDRVWSTTKPFSHLEKLRPGMAAKISPAGKTRFNQRG